MGIFSRKRKKQKEIDEIASRYDPRMMEDHSAVSRKVVVANLCERITKAVTNYDETKKEYDVITAYLKDIETIEHSPSFSKIKEAAHRCQQLIRARQDFKGKERKITDAQFGYFQELEDEIPLAIRRLKVNEEEQTLIKRDLDILEGEKIEWDDLRRRMKRKAKSLRKLAIVVFISFVVLMVMCFVLQQLGGFDMTGPMIVVMALGVVGGFTIYVSKLNNSLNEKRAVVNRNHVVQLTNRVKIKYVSVKNAIDFAQEMYHVKNSYDFIYQWEEYEKRVKDLERMTKNSDDLDIFTSKLEHMLSQLHLYDVKIWDNQTLALDQPKEMVEIKHAYLLERQKLRNQMELMLNDLEEVKSEIRGMTIKDDEYRQELIRILGMVDQIVG